MKTFLEYMSVRDLDLTRKEVELLLRARNKLEGSGFKEVVDQTGNLEDPFIWVPLPSDLGGGLRVYVIFGSLALRPQETPTSFPVGRAEKVEGRHTKEREERQRGEDEEPSSYNLAFDPDYSSVKKLPGEIRNYIHELREAQRKAREKGIAFPQQQGLKFQGFWASPPSAIPLY